MTDNGGDELNQGSEHRLTSLPRWVSAVLVALVVVAGAVGVLHGGGNPPADAAPSRSPTSGPTNVLPSVDPLRLVTSSQDVCTKTDHRRTLTVSFGLVNLSKEPVVVRKVEPVLPLGGLRLTHQSIGLASCRQVFGAQQGRVLIAGGSLVVLFTFGLPKDCPAPYAVQAEVTVSRVDGSRQVSEPVPVLSDLGGIEFDQC